MISKTLYKKIKNIKTNELPTLIHNISIDEEYDVIENLNKIYFQLSNDPSAGQIVEQLNEYEISIHYHITEEFFNKNIDEILWLQAFDDENSYYKIARQCIIGLLENNKENLIGCFSQENKLTLL